MPTGRLLSVVEEEDMATRDTGQTSMKVMKQTISKQGVLTMIKEELPVKRELSSTIA